MESFKRSASVYGQLTVNLHTSSTAEKLHIRNFTLYVVFMAVFILEKNHKSYCIKKTFPFRNVSVDLKSRGVQCVKSVHIWRFSGPYFAVFGLNTERYGVYLRIQSKCWKMRIRKTPNTDTFQEMYLVPCQIPSWIFFSKNS